MSHWVRLSCLLLAWVAVLAPAHGGESAHGAEDAVQPAIMADPSIEGTPPVAGMSAAEAPAANQPDALAESARAPAKDPAGRRVLHEFDETFVCASSERNESTDTETYLLESESVDSWTEMITYQRITFAGPVRPDQFVGLLKSRFKEGQPGAGFRLVQQGRSASIFAVHYPRGASQVEQVEIALATVADPKRPNELHVVQFAVCPERLEVARMEVLIRRWQARFQSQAASLNK